MISSFLFIAFEFSISIALAKNAKVIAIDPSCTDLIAKNGTLHFRDAANNPSCEQITSSPLARFQEKTLELMRTFFYGLLTTGHREAIILDCATKLSLWGAIPLLSLPRCQRAYQRTWSALDFDLKIEDANANHVWFASTFERYMYDSEVKQFLLSVQAEISTGKPFNLWNFTYHHPSIQKNKTKAIAYLGVLFQENESFTKGFANDFKCGLGPDLNQTLIALNKAIKNGQVSAFPEPIVNGGKNIYHFYVMAHVARQLDTLGTSKTDTALILSSFSSIYELSSGARQRLLLRNTQTSDPNSLYDTTSGALFGVDGENNQFRGLDRSAFLELYKKDPDSALFESLDKVLRLKPEA